MLTRKLIAAGCLTTVAAISAASTAAAEPNLQRAAAPLTEQITTHLQVLAQTKPSCHADICVIHNHGAGTMSGFGKVTFTTVITDDTSASPCPQGSYVPRLQRTITTTKGNLVLNEAGFVCPEPKIGPRVDLVWIADGALSTGKFAGAHGTGIDHAYPARNTAAQAGTITLAG
jgi:hypothetical protein